MIITLKNKETLICEDFVFRCSIGRNGITKNKKEGDKKTPSGIFGFGNLYYRKDKNRKPNTKLKCIPITKRMGWCDDPKDKNRYNKLIKIKKIFNMKAFRKDDIYDLPYQSYNSKIPGKGSAIFLIFKKLQKLGCIALKKKIFNFT